MLIKFHSPVRPCSKKYFPIFYFAVWRNTHVHYFIFFPLECVENPRKGYKKWWCLSVVKYLLSGLSRFVTIRSMRYVIIKLLKCCVFVRHFDITIVMYKPSRNSCWCQLLRFCSNKNFGKLVSRGWRFRLHEHEWIASRWNNVPWCLNISNVINSRVFPFIHCMIDAWRWYPIAILSVNSSTC